MCNLGSGNNGGISCLSNDLLLLASYFYVIDLLILLITTALSEHFS